MLSSDSCHDRTSKGAGAFRTLCDAFSGQKCYLCTLGQTGSHILLLVPLARVNATLRRPDVWIPLCPKSRQTMLFSAACSDREQVPLSLNHSVKLLVDENVDEADKMLDHASFLRTSSHSFARSRCNIFMEDHAYKWDYLTVSKKLADNAFSASVCV